MPVHVVTIKTSTLTFSSHRSGNLSSPTKSHRGMKTPRTVALSKQRTSLKMSTAAFNCSGSRARTGARTSGRTSEGKRTHWHHRSSSSCKRQTLGSTSRIPQKICQLIKTLTHWTKESTSRHKISTRRSKSNAPPSDVKTKIGPAKLKRSSRGTMLLPAAVSTAPGLRQKCRLSTASNGSAVL